MFREIFCLGSLATLLFSAGKATSDSLSRKLKTASYDSDDGDYISEIDIEDQIRNTWDETNYCHVLKAYKNFSGYHAVLKNLDGMGAFVDAETIEELNDKIDIEYKELGRPG